MFRRSTSVITSVAIVLVTVLGPVSSAFAQVSTPSNLTLVGGIYTNDTTPTFTWNRPGNATWYEFILDDGTWQSIGNTGEYTLWTLSNGWHTFFLRAHDNAGDISVSTSLTFEIDTQGPSVSAVTPTSAKLGVTTDFSITSTGEAPTMYCQFRVNGRLGEKLHIKNGGGWTLPMTFSEVGSNVVQATCVDTDNNVSNGPVQNISVWQSGSTTPTVTISRGTIVKTQCGSYAPKSDSCHSVYYYGADGKRHGFTSEAVYQSWYGSSFSNVVIISTSQMAAMPIGENVTMRPGTSLVKFMGSTTVYAVEKGGVLRPIVNEAVAKAIYGSRWNSMIVTLPGSVKNDYSYGDKIDSSSDYSKSRAYYSVTSIDENF